jgi:uncharacterized protein YecE (DUF72 family)
MSPNYYVGTSGWHYAHWRRRFYPAELPKKDWLGYYARRFNAVEINASFYRLPQESTLANWRQAVPSGFLFSLKASRFITHIKRLKDIQEPLQTFTGRAKSLLNHLGPLLYQLPPGLQRDDPRLESFLALLNKNLQHVIEFRHSSWINGTVFDLLLKYRVGFCIFDKPGFTTPNIVTASFAYIRFHGHHSLYASSYPEAELAGWADKLRQLSPRPETVYIFFNNDAEGYALDNALTLRKHLQGN